MLTLLFTFIILSIITSLMTIALALNDHRPINKVFGDALILWFYLELMSLLIAIPITFFILIFRFLEA